MAREAIIFIEAENPDKKVYLVLQENMLNDDSNEEPTRDWRIVIGRQALYNLLKGYLEYSDTTPEDIMNPVYSFVVEINMPITKAVNVCKFMKMMKEEGKVVDNSDFNIADYYYEEDDLDMALDMEV